MAAYTRSTTFPSALRPDNTTEALNAFTAFRPYDYDFNGCRWIDN